MSEAGITIVMAGIVQIALGLIAYLSLRERLKHGAEKAEEAVVKAKAVEAKIDDNTAKTESIEIKTDTIVHQTNGAADAMRALVTRIAERVDKLEEYNRSSAHRVLDAINAVHLKLTEMAALEKAAKVAGAPPKG